MKRRAKVGRGASRHGGRWLAAALFVAVLAVPASGCGLSDPYDTDTQATTSEPDPGHASRPAVARDPEDTNPAVRARSRRQLEETSALQHLPLRGDGLTIDFGEVAPDGRLRLTVLYTGTAAAAHDAYRRFLARWGDTGSGYVVAYQHRSPGGPTPAAPPASLRKTPEAVLEAVAVAAGNWYADELTAAYSRAIALSVGGARAGLSAAEARARTGAERVGASLHSHADVIAIDVSGSGASRKAVVVIRQGLGGGGLPDSAYTYQVVLAKVDLKAAGWAVSSWEPQS